MKRYVSMFIAIVILPGWALATVSSSGFSRYDVILARKPFGAPPVKPVSVIPQKTVPVAPKDSFVKYLSMIAVTDDELGTRVGLYDKKAKRSYFIEVGGVSEDGIRLLEADFEGGGAVLRKGEETYTLYIDGRAESHDGTVVGTSPAPRPMLVVPEMTTTRNNTGGKALSYVERLRLRRENHKKAENIRIEDAARRKIAAADKEKMLRAYNMELIRAKGKKGKPLPMTLTPEEDALLVKEGVLPPRNK